MIAMWPESAGDSFLLQNALFWQKQEELIEQNDCLLKEADLRGLFRVAPFKNVAPF